MALKEFPSARNARKKDSLASQTTREIIKINTCVSEDEQDQIQMTGEDPLAAKTFDDFQNPSFEE
jgi:hypothetical protein